MNYAIVATATAISAFLLGLGWLFAGDLLHKRWSLEPTVSSLLVGRRLGAAYIGIAVMLFLSRSAPASDLRTSLCVGMLAAMTVLAVLGLLEFRARRAGKGILASVILESLLGVGYAWVLLVPTGS